MRIRTKYLNILFPVVFLQTTVYTQEPDQEHQMYIDQIIEILSEEKENPEDLAALFDDLNDYLQKPLNLNSASSEELAELYALNPFQIAALIDYRNTQGNLLSVYELLYIPGYRQKDVELIKPFVTCAEPSVRNPGLKNCLSPVSSQLLLRYQRVLELQKGYVPPDDTVLADNPDVAHYLGSPDKLYLRYKVESGRNFYAGILMEKDAGEEFFCGTNRKGFDFYSGYINCKNPKGLIKQLMLGDYHIRMGQGLIAWSSSAFGKSSRLSDLCRKQEHVKANTSSEENRIFRGSAIVLGIRDFSITAFASGNTIDASVRTDTVSGKEFVTAITGTGYHATPNDLEHENDLKLRVTGAVLSYNGNRLKLGLNGLITCFGKNLTGGDELYEQYNYSGNLICGISFDYQYLGRKTRFFGETACSARAYAVLNGILFYVKPELSLGIVHRHYDKDYYSYWSDAFGETGRVGNEDGFYMGVEWESGENSFHLYSDVFFFPWLRYHVNTPSEGYDILGEWGKTFGNVQLYLRLRHEDKPVNRSVEGNLYRVEPLRKEQFRLNSVVPLGNSFVLQNRIVLSRGGFRGDTIHTGIFILQDVTVRSLPVPLDISLRVAYFQTGDYNTRIYAYERDLLYAAGSQMYYGKGWRYMMLLTWRPARHISFWCKFGQTIYPGKETVGSGLSEIQGNHRSEIKMQMIVNF